VLGRLFSRVFAAIVDTVNAREFCRRVDPSHRSHSFYSVGSLDTLCYRDGVVYLVVEIVIYGQKARHSALLGRHVE
jgi:hypothetical protein